MAQAFGDMLPFAVALAIGPIPNIVVLLLLSSAATRTTSLTFFGGWLAGLVISGAVVLLIADPADPGDADDPATWLSLLRLALALLLLAYAVKGWRTRPVTDDAPKLPKWMGALETTSAGRAALIGIVLATVNPKSLAFVVSGVTAIASVTSATGDQIVTLVLFALIGSLGVALPILIAVALGERGAAMLASMRDWMARNSTAIMSGVFLILGVKVLGDAIAGLVG